MLKQLINCSRLQGADFVEFDVHLSRDLVPIVYHDFTVNLAAHSVSLIIINNPVRFSVSEIHAIVYVSEN